MNTVENIEALKKEIMSNEIISPFIKEIVDLDSQSFRFEMTRYSNTLKKTDNVKCIVIVTEQHYCFMCNDTHEAEYIYTKDRNQFMHFITEVISSMLSIVFDL